MVFKLSLLEHDIETLKLAAGWCTVQDRGKRFWTDIARGQRGCNVLGLSGSSRLDHRHLSVTGSHKGNSGGGMRVNEGSQSLFDR
jgi:hypothetical protein